MRSRVHARAGGFTFIEILLAIMLVLGLFGSALWFYRHIGEVRNDVSEEMRKIVAQRLVMDRITKELRSSQVAAFINVGVEGQTDHVTFVTTALPGKAAWVVQDVADAPLPPEQDIRLVSYGLRYVEEDDGLTYIAGLEAKIQKLLTAQVIEEEGAEATAGGDDSFGVEQGSTSDSAMGTNHSALLSPYIQFVRFRYWDGTEWLDEWLDQGLPLAIEVAIGEEPMPEGVEPAQYEFDLARRIVALPTATPPSQTGDLIRGLGGGL